MDEIRTTDIPLRPKGDGRRDPEILAELFQPELILPEQLQHGFRRDSLTSGEKALMLAILEDAIRCFQEHRTSGRPSPQILARQVEEWICRVDHKWTFSFNNCCETLGIDPDMLREKLLTWKAKRLEAARSTIQNGDGVSQPKGKVYRLHLRNRRSNARPT